MTSEIAAALGSLKAAREIAQALIGIRDTALIQSKVLELQGEIITAQSHTLASQEAQSALLERIRQLEKEIADFETWEAERQKYELKQVWKMGTFAYALKEKHRSFGDDYYICPNCYEDRRKSILQGFYNGSSYQLDCPRCNLTIHAP